MLVTESCFVAQVAKMITTVSNRRLLNKPRSKLKWYFQMVKELKDMEKTEENQVVTWNEEEVLNRY